MDSDTIIVLDEVRQKRQSQLHKRVVQQQSISSQSNEKHDEQRREDSDLRYRIESRQRIQFSHYSEEEAQHYNSEIRRLIDKVNRRHAEF